MQITEALKSLENSWSREDVLVKIKNGEDSEKIINDFFNTKKQEIETLTNFIKPKDQVLLCEIENLSNIESKLINKIKDYGSEKVQLLEIENDKTRFLQSDQNLSFNLGFFMMKWSNRFVFITLLAICSIALSKQAWA